MGFDKYVVIVGNEDPAISIKYPVNVFKQMLEVSSTLGD